MVSSSSIPQKRDLELSPEEASLSTSPKQVKDEENGPKYEECQNYLGALEAIPRNLRLMYLHSYQSFVWNNMATKRLKLYHPTPVIGDLTSEQAAQYTFADVVLPLPGYDVEYPTHALRSSYTTFMAQHNVDPFSMHRKHNTASLPGSYRKIICKPRDVAWKLLRYTDPECDLAITDLDRLQGRKEVETVEGGARVAVVVEFTLGSE
ncbi:pseudouridine synthase [Fimicolochytrium jonesii]|uniref:pseudouridine synthase n=1 Tax=Fimicolochytrium jonesii TaxID=1396493 RepID=UPI0022FE7856|nr:pseudouridine synthase [Fimicolochytrium jonesii]KAI8819114.1 pseudouridine synthase [Fimicolochytrium jonesii]